MHYDSQQIPLCIYHAVALAPLDFLARVITAPPPFSAVLADCESIIATVGVAFRPPAFHPTDDDLSAGTPALRPCSRSALVTRSHAPSSRHARNC